LALIDLKIYAHPTKLLDCYNKAMNIVQTPVLQSLDAKTNSLAEILAVFNRDGGVIVLNMLSQDVVGKLQAELVEPTVAIAPGAKTDDPMIQKFWGSNTKRFTRLAWRSKTFADHVLVHPLFREVADAALLANCASYWMNTGQMMIIGPGEKAQWIHRDADNWPAMCSLTAPDVTISCMFAITDFTSDVGATQVVPGSHLWGDFSRQPEPHEIVQAVMPAGSGLIYSGKVLHGGGANNTSDVWRQGLHLSYLLGWLTPEEAGCIGVPQDIAKNMTPQQQQLLGYRAYVSNDLYAARLWTVDYEDVPVGLNWQEK